MLDHVVSTSHDLVKFAHTRSTAAEDYMHEQSLHCTSHVSIGPDRRYEEVWHDQKLEEEGLWLKHVYWSEEAAAVSVSLSPSQEKMLLGSTPHISLAKPSHWEWQDLGPWLQQCLGLTDFRPGAEDPHEEYSASGNVGRTTLNTRVSVHRTVELVEEHTQYAELYPIAAADGIPELSQVPPSLWAAHKYDVGLIKGAASLVVCPKSNYRPCLKQYPLKQEAIEGIRPVFESLLKSGIIVPCEDSPVRTPIFPVKKVRDKGQPTEWRFVQDLQAVNAATYQRAPEVANPHTILSLVPPGSTHFSVIDLANAFFSVPVHPDSQSWFGFSFNGRGYTWTRCPMGYHESPGVFHRALSENLQNLQLPAGSALLNYVDDMMICSPSKEACKIDTVALLKHLAENGHKASLQKLQFALEQVTYLGHVITAEGKSLSPKRIGAIQSVPKPITKKQMMSFLGMTSYCRQWIPNYSEREAPLSSMVHGKGLSAHDKLTWTTEADKAFQDLKTSLSQAPTLGLPRPDLPYTQFIDQKDCYMTSVLCQPHGGKLRPVAYFSSKLDPVASGLPLCLRAVAAAERAILASRDIVGYSDVTLMVPHAVSHILHAQKTSHLSAQRWLRYHTTLLELPNVIVKRCNVLNPATLLPTADDGEPHDCVEVLQQTCVPRPDLSDTPLPNADLELFVDGSASRSPETGSGQVGFSVVTSHSTLVSGRLPSHFSAQAAELIALTEACKVAEGKTANIYTDSRYAFGVVHDFGALWRHRGFLTSSGKPIAHHTLVSALLDAILLPRAIAVVKCEAHTSSFDPVSVGNRGADVAAKKAASQGLLFPLAQMLSTPTDPSPHADLPTLQSLASAQERSLWKRSGAVLGGGIWTGPDSRPCLPRALFHTYAKLSHGRDHVGKGGMCTAINANWYTRGFSTFAADFCRKCVICAANNASGAIKVPQQGHPPPDKPFEHLMMDFIELTPSEGKKYCLVIVCMFSKWVEVFPTSKQDAGTVAKILMREIIPRWGIPQLISSDNGPGFANQAIDEISQYLGFNIRHHCSYHPQSAGAVERENGTIKSKLAKCCEETGLSWVKALPLVLFHMRMRIRNKHSLSPFEIVFGRPPCTGVGPVKLAMTTGNYEDSMLRYCANLSSSLSTLHGQVKAALPSPATAVQHHLKPGDWVLIKDHRRKHWKQRRYTGPFQVLLTTETAVKVEGKATWVHASHCKRIPDPGDEGAPTSGSG
uniref:ribonuclease H n=1 Tax=Gasterosteus aculeatus aculeatus TaxID=481459 RepID=A0AAQ4RQ79_GASAC